MRPGTPADRTGMPADCAYCGRSFTASSGPGRPRKYCRRSCRQRAFEQRRLAGDQAWAEGRLIRLAAEMADLEDRIDDVREVVEDLMAEVADGAEIDGTRLVERLEVALGLR